MKNCSKNLIETKIPLSNFQNSCITFTSVCFFIVILICETEQFCLEGSKVEVDFRTVLFGFAFLLVVSFPLDLFASGGKIRKVKK